MNLAIRLLWNILFIIIIFAKQDVLKNVINKIVIKQDIS